MSDKFAAIERCINSAEARFQNEPPCMLKECAQNGVDEARADLADWREQEKLLARWKKAVEGLTPGGSEFVDDPEYCAAYIRKRCNYPRMIIEMREREAKYRELLEAAVQADLQIEYMQSKFKETGSGNSVRAQLQRAIAACTKMEVMPLDRRSDPSRQ